MMGGLAPQLLGGLDEPAEYGQFNRLSDVCTLRNTQAITSSTSVVRNVQCESKNSPPSKAFCDIFTCGEPV